MVLNFFFFRKDVDNYFCRKKIFPTTLGSVQPRHSKYTRSNSLILFLNQFVVRLLNGKRRMLRFVYFHLTWVVHFHYASKQVSLITMFPTNLKVSNNRLNKTKADPSRVLKSMKRTFSALSLRRFLYSFYGHVRLVLHPVVELLLAFLLARGVFGVPGIIFNQLINLL